MFQLVEVRIVTFLSAPEGSISFPPFWPSMGAPLLARLAVCHRMGGAWARCVGSALVKEGQLLSAAEEGTEKQIQCVRHGQWLVPRFLANALALPPREEYGVRKTVEIVRNCRELLVVADPAATAWKFFVFFPVGGPRRWRQLSHRSGVPVCPAPCKT